MIKLTAALFALTALSLADPAFGGSESELGGSDEAVPIDIFEMENSYVFGSDLHHGGSSFGDQYAWQNGFRYGHRFLITGNWYAHAGVAYNRFDFGNTSAPVPVHLQSGAAVIGIEYMKGEDIGALLQFRPGFYTEEDIGLNSFDCPITLARFWVLQPEKLYLLTGVNYSFLRGTFGGVIPVVGLVWKPSETLRIMAIPPEPRVIYTVSKQLDLYLGGEVEGGSFRTDHHREFIGTSNAKLSGAQVDYADYRAGAGFIYSLNDHIGLDFGGGYAIQRAFGFHRADETYRTDPAPYLRFELKAKF